MKKKDVEKIVNKAPQNPVAQHEGDILDAQTMQMLEDKLPQWVKELQNDGTAVLRWNLEFLILIQEILIQDFGFSQGDMVKLETKIKEMLPHLHEMQLNGLTILNHENMKVAMKIVELNKAQIQQAGKKIIMPGVKRIKS
jgi:hypothetical protein